MRILYADEWASYPLALAGGHRSAHALLGLLAREPGVECMSLVARDGRGVPGPDYYPKLTDFEPLGIREFRVEPGGGWVFDCGYPVRAVGDVRAALAALLKTFRPDALYCQTPDSLPLLRDARRAGVGGVWYLRDTRPAAADVRAAVGAGVRLLCCSRFLREHYRASCGVEPAVVYPLVRAEDYRVGRGGAAFVTFVNPHRLKGFETFLGMLPLLPEERFLVVESWPLAGEFARVRESLSRFPNVRLLARVPDAREVYRQTRLLLVPSVLEEAAGRVVVEAQASGIPAVVSGRGGLPEMVGEGGVVVEDYLNPRAWAAVVERLRRDGAEARRLSAAARRNAGRAEFSAAHIVGRFLEACRESCRLSAAGSL